MSDCRHNAPNREPNAGDVQTQWQQLDEQDREKMVDRLIDCLYSVEGETDIEELDRCLEELDAAGAVCEPFDVERGLKDIHERYAAAFESSPKKVKKTARFKRPLARIAIIAAALCAFVFTAQASGFDILGAIARWTSEQFSFVRVGEERGASRDAEYESLQSVLDTHQIVEELAPKTFPEGTVLEEVRVKEGKNGLVISATYVLSGEMFWISIRQTEDAPHMEIEINDQNVEPYEVDGILHHLMSDVKQRKVMWYNGNWECYIAGDLSRNDLLMMIDSIYK